MEIMDALNVKKMFAFVRSGWDALNADRNIPVSIGELENVMNEVETSFGNLHNLVSKNVNNIQTAISPVTSDPNIAAMEAYLQKLFPHLPYDAFKTNFLKALEPTTPLSNQTQIDVPKL